MARPRNRAPPPPVHGATTTRGVWVSTLLKILIAFFLPPISVLMTNGFGLQFLLNVVLTILFVMPGSFHALWLMLRDR